MLAKNASFNSFDESEEEDFSPGPVMIPVVKPTEVRNPNFRCARPLLATSSRATVDGFRRQVCDNLMCSDCNISIRTFQDCKWRPGCDYLFFRSYWGLPEKLSSGLQRQIGGRAYHCGCRGVTIDSPRFTEDLYGFRWLCMGHSDDSNGINA